jgi:sugar phosphate isomerase/epimerase
VNKIGLQLYTVRNLLKTSVEKTIEKISSIGYKGVEISSIPSNISYKEVYRVCTENKLEISSLFSDFSGNTLKELEDLKCNVLVSSKTQDYFTSIERIKKTCDELNQTYKQLKSNGISFGIHNHWWEFEELNDVPVYRYLINYLDPEIFFELDVYWAKIACNVETIIKNVSQIKFLHIKDGPLTKTDSMVAVGQGKMDFSEILKFNMDWKIVELDSCSTDILIAIKESFNFIQEHKTTLT